MSTTPKHSRTSRLTEVVETHNIYLSLNRLNAAPYDSARKRRALYHAMLMHGCFGTSELTAIRQALNLP